MSGALTILALVVIFGLVVLVHEFGHFIIAKMTGVHVEEFALGFGKNLFTRTFRGTQYKINLLPLGGYVKLEGEEREEGKIDSPTSFQSKSLPVKVAVFIAGIVMNIILAIIVFVIYLPLNNYSIELVNLVDFRFVGAQNVKSLFPIEVVSYTEEEGTAAENAGIKAGDRIVEINGRAYKNVEEFQNLLKEYKGQNITVGLYDTEKRTISNVNVTLPNRDEKILGVMITYFDYPFYLVEYPKSIFSSIAHTFNIGAYQFPAIGALISKSVSESDPSYAAQSINGIVGVSAIVNDIIVAEQFLMLVNLTAVISVSLAIFNLLPLPILDGGQIVIAIIEKLRNKKFSEKTMERVNVGSFLFVIFLTIFVTLKDVWQFEIIGGIVDSIRKILGLS